VKRHNHLKIGQYHQHLMELLDAEATPLQCVPSVWLPAGIGPCAEFWRCTPFQCVS